MTGGWRLEVPLKKMIIEIICRLLGVYVQTFENLDNWHRQDVIRGRLEEERRTSEGEASDYRLRDCEVRAEYGARRGREVESAGTKLTKCIMWLPLPESTNF